MKKSEMALKLFEDNFNCAQSVLAPFAESMGMDADAALRVSSGFGAGIARQGNVCGAVTGGLMVIGLKYGKDLSSGPEAKELCYHKTDIFLQSFAKSLGSTVCTDLLEQNPDEPVNWNKIQEEGKFKTHCPVFVETAVLLLEEILKD